MTEEILKGLIKKDEIKEILRNRSKEYYQMSVKKGAEKPYLEEGWKIYKELKTKTQLRKQKPIGELFEDKVWCTLAKMGFEEMSADRNFKIPITEKVGENKKIGPKQIDIFLKNRDVAVLIECKALSEAKKQNIKDLLVYLNGLRGGLVRSIREHYGPKLEVRWVLATKNMIINESNRALAKNYNIYLLEDDEITYFEELVKQIGEIAKYQFLAEVFEGKNIHEMEVKVPAIKGKMGKHTFYSFLIEPEKILPLAFVSHRMRTNRKTVEMYQRMLEKKRLLAIRGYITNEKGMFPNSIILNFKVDSKLTFEPMSNKEIDNSNSKVGILHLPSKYRSAWVIDGQHRLYGFVGTEEEKEATLPIIAFENLENEEQSKLFIDINSKQKRVSGNLLVDLQADLLWYSPDASERLSALISKLVLELNSDPESPLYLKILSPGQRKTDSKPITILGLATPIKKTRLIGTAKKRGKEIIQGPLYDEDMESTLSRSKTIISSYLDIFKNEMPEHWELGSAYGGYLCTNNGLGALLKVLKEIITHIEKNSSIPIRDFPEKELVSEIGKYARPLASYFKQATQDEIMRFRGQSLGEGGMTNVSFAMMEIIHNALPEFNPHGLEKWMEQNNSVWTEKARDLVPEIQLMIAHHVIGLLKKEFGENDEEKMKGWWWEGVPVNIRQEVEKRRQTEGGTREKSFLLLDYKKIISSKSNWKLFKEIYGLKEYGNSKDKSLSWFDNLNKIRNKISHPERGNVSKDQLEFLEKIHETLKERIEEEENQ